MEPRLGLVALGAALALVLALARPAAGQPSGQELCQSSQLSSFLCKAGQAVLGGAAKLAHRVLRRPKHWGVPDDEPLELNDDFHQGAAGAAARPLAGRPKRRERVYCETAAGLRGVCRPLAACYHRHGPALAYELDARQCPGGLALVCCPKARARPAAAGESAQSAPVLQLGGAPAGPALALEALRAAVAQVFGQADGERERAQLIERKAHEERLWLRRDSASDRHQRFIRLRDGDAVARLARDGAAFLAVAAQVARGLPGAGPNRDPNPEEGCRRNKVSADGTLVTQDAELGAANCSAAGPQRQRAAGRRRWHLPELDFSQTELAARCPGEPVCGPEAAREPYRSYDGACNNLRHGAWGRANSAYARILAPDYEDGVGELRLSGPSGRPLPNARSASLASARWSERADPRASLLLMQWGQFLDHDLSLAATTPMQNAQGATIDCCNRRLLLDARFKHPACISVLLPDDDPFYAAFQVGCMNLVRSAAAPPADCRLRAREQLNQLTHFLDGSQIYGSDQRQALGLRQMRAGLLKSSRINGLEFLPFDARLGEGCVLPTAGVRRGMRCFVAGDQRVNELAGLASVHALLLREHNRVARLLAALNPNWRDERLYQEARRFVVAELQHITYNEWLPLLLGPLVMRDFKLELSQTNGGYSLDYSAATEPTILNEFAAAAFRLHSLVQGSLKLQTEDGQLVQQFKLRHIFNNPAALYRDGNFDGCLNAMANEPAQALDSHFSEELTNHLFQDTNSSFGMDLVAINLQRGRDHGLAGYNAYRQACGLSRLSSFEQLDGVMVEGAGELFARLYAHVDDIELFIAGNYEKKLRDAMLGPVFACIVAEQFRRLKAGDRYWFENGNQAGAFTPSQLAELKRTSMARLICDNSDGVERVQPLAFLRQAAAWNPKVACDQIPWADLRHWQQDNLEPFDPFTFRGSREPAARRLDSDPATDPDPATIDDGLD